MYFKTALVVLISIISWINCEECILDEETIQGLRDRAESFRRQYTFDTSSLNKSQPIKELYSHRCHPSNGECYLEYSVGDSEFSDSLEENYNLFDGRYITTLGSYEHTRDYETVRHFYKKTPQGFRFENQFTQTVYVLPIRNLDDADLLKNVNWKNDEQKNFITDLMDVRREAYTFMKNIAEADRDLYYLRITQDYGYSLHFKNWPRHTIINENTSDEQESRIRGVASCGKRTQNYEIHHGGVVLVGKVVEKKD